MKTFVAFESARPTRGRWTFKVYQIKRNRICYIAEGDISYASTRGEQSEVYNVLIDNNILPKSWAKKSKYYEDRPYGKIYIQYICPQNQK